MITIEDFLTECCVLDPDVRTSTRALFASWCSWQSARRRAPGTLLAFSKLLHGAGFERYRTNYDGGFIGVRLAEAPAVPSQVERLLAAREAVSA